MEIKDIKIGESYYHKDNTCYTSRWFAKVVKILKAHEGVNTNNFIIVKCEWSSSRDGLVGIIKYFRPKDLEALTNKVVEEIPQFKGTLEQLETLSITPKENIKGLKK